MSYILDEALGNLKLDEAFSDSMPQWMRSRMQQSAKGFGGIGGSIYGSRHSGETNLLKLIIKAGYDPSKLNIQTLPVPETFDDPIFNDPDKLPVLHVVSDKDSRDSLVWIMGINDEERFYDKNGRERPFKTINNKAQLKDYIKDFAVIDLSLDDTHQPDSTVNRDHNINRQYSGKGQNIGVVYDYGSHAYSKLGGVNDPKNYRIKDTDQVGLPYSGSQDVKDYFDKSGYFRGSGIISPLLKSKLKEYSKSLIPKKLLKYEQDLIGLRKAIAQATLLMDDDNSLDSDSRELQTIYFDAIDQFKKALSRFDPNNLEYSASYIQSQGYLDKVKSAIDLINNKTKQYNKASFVW